jgi:hypothetical protein
MTKPPLIADDIECRWAIARNGKMREQLVRLRGVALQKQGLIELSQDRPTLTAAGWRVVGALLRKPFEMWSWRQTAVKARLPTKRLYRVYAFSRARREKMETGPTRVSGVVLGGEIAPDGKNRTLDVTPTSPRLVRWPSGLLEGALRY